MPFQIDYTRAKLMADKLTRYYEEDELVFLPREYGHDGWYVFVTLPDLSGGLLLHVSEIDNGAAGFKSETLARINALRDGVDYTPPPEPEGLKFDDVITTYQLDVTRRS